MSKQTLLRMLAPLWGGTGLFLTFNGFVSGLVAIGVGIVSLWAAWYLDKTEGEDAE